MDIEIDIFESPYKTIESYFEKAKRLKKKMEKAKEALEKLKKSAKEEREENSNKKKLIEKRKKFWFEKFYYGLSKNNFLIIAGRDAYSNEEIIKKYTESNDLVFHSNIQGSPFVVLKNGLNTKEEDKLDAAIIAATYSKAIKEGFSAVDVYAIKKEQVSKKAKSGEFLQKGSFMIYGERQWFKNTRLGIVISFENYEGSILPFIRSKFSAKKGYYISKGKEKKSDIAKKIAKEISYNDLDAIIRQLPPANLSMKKI